MKKKYIPPQIKKQEIELEKGIAAAISITPTVGMTDWTPDPDAGTNTEGDVWLPIQ